MSPTLGSWVEKFPFLFLFSEISVRLYVCLLACLLVSVGLRARIAGQNVCVSMAEQLLTPSQQVTSG